MLNKRFSLIIVLIIILLSLVSCKKNDALEYQKYFEEKTQSIESLLLEGDLIQAYKIAKDILYCNHEKDEMKDNYFTDSYMISDEDDKDYFNGKFKKQLIDFKTFTEQLSIAASLIENSNTYDKKILTDMRIQQGFNIAVSNKKKKELEEKEEEVTRNYSNNVKTIIESFIKRNSTWGIVGIKDALVDRMNFRVVSQDSVKNDYGYGFKYLIEGVYKYKNANFSVKCELETAGMNSYYATVEVN